MALRFDTLTRPAIRNLKRGGRLTEHGITAWRQASGDVRYSVNIMVDGQRIHRVIGRESQGTTRQQAEDAIAAFRTKAREGTLDLPERRKRHRLFKEAAEDYLKRIKGHPKHGKNLPRKQAHVRDKLAPFFKSVRLDRIEDEQIAAFVEQRTGEGASRATINRELSTLSHLLNRAVEWKWVRTKPRIDKFSETRKQIETLTNTERAALMRAAIGDQDPSTWLFVAIAMGSGMRHSEILRIKWEQVGFDSLRIHIPEAKAGMREQPILTSLANRLKEEWQARGRPKGWLFPSSRADAKSPHRTAMGKQFARTVKRAGLDPDRVTPHILRHTLITELVKKGVDLPTIQRVSGHKTLQMVLRYTQIADAHVDESVRSLDASFSDAITPDLHTGPKVASLPNARERKKA